MSVYAAQCSASSSTKCYQQYFKNAGASTTLCYKNANDGNNYNACSTYSTNDAYAANTYVSYQFGLEMYVGCAAYEVINEDGAAISRYLVPYCADQGGTVHLGFFQDVTCPTPGTYNSDYLEPARGLGPVHCAVVVRQ